MKKLMMTVAVVAAAGCADSSAGPLASSPSLAQSTRASWRVDLRAERAALLSADRALEAATRTQGFEAGFLPALAADAHFLPAGQNLIQGTDAIRAFLQWSGTYGTATWQTFRADVSADGGSGYTLSTGELTRKSGEKVHLRFINYWEKQGGAWTPVAVLPVLAAAAARPVPEGFGTPADNGVAGAEPSHGSAAGALAAAMQADRDFAAMASAETVNAAFVHFVAPTGVIIGGPQYGAADIDNGGAGGGTLEWGPIAGRGAASGDLAYTIGYATARGIGPDGKPAVNYTKYLSVWQRQPNGEWRYLADGGTWRPAP